MTLRNSLDTFQETTPPPKATLHAFLLTLLHQAKRWRTTMNAATVEELLHILQSSYKKLLRIRGLNQIFLGFCSLTDSMLCCNRQNLISQSITCSHKSLIVQRQRRSTTMKASSQRKKEPLFTCCWWNPSNCSLSSPLAHCSHQERWSTVAADRTDLLSWFLGQKLSSLPPYY